MKAVISDVTQYRRAQYGAFISAWGKAGLMQGRDFQDTITVDLASFPNNTQLEWRWPNVAAPKGVYGYDMVSYGQYYGSSSSVEKPITPKQVSAITGLMVSSNFSIGGEVANFNVIIDFFLTAHANGVPNGAERLAEIEIFLHASAAARAWAYQQKRVGIHTDHNGVDWMVSSSAGMEVGGGPDLLFMPMGDVLFSSVNVADMIHWLQVKGVLTGAEWFNGLAIGVEPVQGSGSMTLDAFSTYYT